MQHGALTKALKAALPVIGVNHPKVLVPGAGLGRLAVELVSEGYDVKATELSQYMALPAHFIINMVNKRECIPIHPWVTSPGNSFKASDCTREVFSSMTYQSYLILTLTLTQTLALAPTLTLTLTLTVGSRP